MGMMHVVKDEWYPVYSLDEQRGYDDVDVPDTLRERFDRAMEEFDAVQVELADIYNARRP